MSSSIITRSNSSKLFLSRRIPDLQFDNFAFYVNSLDFLNNPHKIHSNSRNETLSVGVVRESEQQT